MLTLILATTLICGLFTACGGNANSLNTEAGNINKDETENNLPSMQAILMALHTKDTIEFPISSTTLSFENGSFEYYFKEYSDYSNIEEIAYSKGAMNEPYCAYCVKVKDAEKAEEVVQKLKTAINLSMWTDKTFDIEHVVRDNVICTVAISTEYADTVTAKDILDEFLDIDYTDEIFETYDNVLN